MSLNFDLWLRHVQAQFPTGSPVKFSYPAMVVGGRTLIFIKLSELMFARAEAEKRPDLPRPVLPIAVLDEAIPTEMPGFVWVCSDKFGLWIHKGIDRLRALHRGDIPGYVPSSMPEPLPKEDCVECQFSIYPCAKHIME